MTVDVFTPQSFRKHALLKSRSRETVFLACASLAVIFFVWRVWQAKQPLLEEAGRRIQSGQVLVLSPQLGVERLQQSLNQFEDTEQRRFIARRISAYLRGPDSVPNVGALGLITITEADLTTKALRDRYGERIQQSRQKTIRLLSTEDLSERVKPFLAVRTPDEVRSSLWRWTSLLLLTFWLTHVLWTLLGCKHDPYLLPVLLALSGVGFTVMVSLRDPVRDRLSFAAFAGGVVAGCISMFAVVSVAHLMKLRSRGSLPGPLSAIGPAIDAVADWNRRLMKRSWLPLGAAIALSFLLAVFGSGPGGSGARVSLGSVQPGDLLRLLVLLFLASFLAQRWEFLRKLREKRVLPWLELPRLDHALPVIVAVGAMICFFFIQRDLGPAMVLAALFLGLYAVARKRVGLVSLGAGAFALVVYIAYKLGFPAVASTRVRLWLWPWNSGLAEGEQTAQAFWAMASGGWTGAGLGRGSPSMIPEAHTDMILPAWGEEAGLIGLLCVLALFAILIGRSLRIAYRSATPYAFFLALGLTMSVALQLILIAAGSIGLFPLSGVVTPFLSYGKASAIVNFFSMGLLLAISATAGTPDSQSQFRRPLIVLSAMIGLAFLAIGWQATLLQLVHADEVAASGALIRQSDGTYTVRYNPRLTAIDRRLSRGSIFDRNGVPLATGDCTTLEKSRKTFDAIGIKLAPGCAGDERKYPLGPAAFHLIGNTGTMYRWTATNTAFEEKQSRKRLKGWDNQESYIQLEVQPSAEQVWVRTYDYTPLLPILRKGMDSTDPDIRKVVDAPRDVRLSIDARLQMRLTTAFARHVSSLGKRNGAVVVLKPSTGEVLASVSLPLPDAETPDVIDSAQFGEYPPGSALKVLTAIAALRHDPSLQNRVYMCGRLPGGRVGAVIRGEPIRDDILDDHPHGSLRMSEAIAQSCNAWFAQAGNEIGAHDLLETAKMLNIEMASPNNEGELQRLLSQSAFGQGEVVATPMRMARLAGAIANSGVLKAQKIRLDPPEGQVQDIRMIPAGQAGEIARAMRQAVTSGTGRTAAASPVQIAGKTGTAELSKAPSHGWFIGYLPANAPASRRIAFAILVVNGGYGGRSAAPFAPILAGLLQELKLL